MFDRLKRLRKRDADVDLEIRGHLETELEERITEGEDPAHASAAASRAFGNRMRAFEDTRAVWGWPAVEAFIQDVRYGGRLLRRAPGFALFAIVSLALGIGATTAIFTLFDAIVLRTLPVKEPDRLITMAFSTGGDRTNSNLPYPQFDRMRKDNRTLEGLFAISLLYRISIGSHGQSELGKGILASGDYYPTLGIQPALGRLLTPEDDRPGNGLAVISYGCWQRRFGASPSAIGSAILINQVPFTVIGVEPREFLGERVGSTREVVIPMQARNLISPGKQPWDEAFSTWIELMGRLKPGVIAEQAERDLEPIFFRATADAAAKSSAAERANFERVARQTRLFVTSGAGGIYSDLREGYQRWLRLLLWLLSAVMLMASLNVATLLLSRSEARRNEIATRLSLGAGRLRIVRQLLTESLLLAAGGAVGGIVIAWWGSRALLWVALPNQQELPLHLALDGRVFGFTIAMAAGTCLLFGLLPALRATASQRVGTFTREVSRRRRGLLDRSLVACQVALSVVLVVFAGLFLRSLGNLWAQDAGYNRANVLMFSVDAGLAGKKGAAAASLYGRLLEELRAEPGAQSVAVSSVRPVDDGYYLVDVVSHIGSRQLGEDRIRIAHNHLSPGYFATLGVPLLAGRDFDHRDDGRASKVAIISETMALRRFPGQNPVGQTITMHRTDTREIVGVARDVRYGNVKDAPRDVVYRPMFESDEKAIWYSPSFEIRYAGSLDEISRRVRAAASRVAPELTLFRMKTLEKQTEESFARERLLAMLTAYFGSFALLLACIGLYGLMSCVVTQRTPEIGLRMALGARPPSVQWLVLRESALMAVVGAGAGAAGAAGCVRLVRAQLYGVEPADPLTFTAAVSILLLLALAASYLPAARASRIDPVRALRSE
jgi:predicted permease